MKKIICIALSFIVLFAFFSVSAMAYDFSKIPHVHKFDDAWWFDGQSDNHYHMCTYTGCEEKSEVTPHNWEETDRIDPVDGKDGEIHYWCRTCSAGKTEIISAYTDFTIISKCSEGGTVTPNKKSGKVGDYATFVIKPDEGYRIGVVLLNEFENKGYTLGYGDGEGEDGWFQFKPEAGNHVVYVEFEKISDTNVEIPNTGSGSIMPCILILGLFSSIICIGSYFSKKKTNN